MINKDGFCLKAARLFTEAIARCDCWWSLTSILTINIPHKTKVKQHHMCQFIFIIHLVPLVLREIICMQEISQKWTNKVHRRQVDMTDGCGPTWWGRPTPPSVARWPHPLAMSLIRGRASTLPHQPWSMSVWCKGGGWAALDPWAHCHSLGGRGAKPTSKLTSWPQQPTYLPCNHLWEPSSTVGWQGGARHCRSTPPRSVNAPASPPSQLCLQVPPALYTL
jgi:hypothetical protein